MTNLLQRYAFKRLYTGYGFAVLLVYFFLMLVAFPWWRSANHPILLNFGVDEETRILLRYTPEETVPLVPTGDLAAFHWSWATELPPRRGYDLSLEFPDGTNGEAILKEVLVLDLKASEQLIPLDLSVLADVTSNDVRIRKLGSSWGILARPGGSFELPDEILNTAIEVRPMDWVVASWGFLLIAGMGFLVLITALNFPHTLEPRKRRVPASENTILAAGIVAGIAIHLHLVAHSLPGYGPGDSTAYLMQALVSGPSTAQAHESLAYLANALPGYPLFLRIVLQHFNGDINALLLLQGGLYGGSVLLLALSFRRLVHGHLLGAVSVIILISPVGVWASRQVDHLSLSASFWVISLAAFVFLWQRTGWIRIVGWVLFGIPVTCAACIHFSGLILLALPLSLLAGAFFWCYFNWGGYFWRLSLFWHTVGQTAIPVILVTAALSAIGIGHSIRGETNALAGVHKGSAALSAGYLDAAAAGTGERYNAFINSRNAEGYNFDGWSLREHFSNELLSNGNFDTATVKERLDAALVEFDQRNSQKIPFQMRLVGAGRVVGWALMSAQRMDYSREYITPSYQVPHAFPVEQMELDVGRELGFVSSATDISLGLLKPEPDPFVSIYNQSIVPIYPLLYRGLIILSFVAWLFALSERKSLAAACLTPFYLVVLCQVWRYHVPGAAVQVHEAVLWMATLAGLICIGNHTLQIETAGDDRRCLPPVKHRRLLSRKSDEPDRLVL